jgi:hypothetical protein
MGTGTYFGGWATPGQGTLDITSERQILQGYAAINGLTILTNGVLDGAARDAGNSPTNVCRMGLTLGVISSTGHYTNYSATASDGSQKAVGFLFVETLTQDFSGNNADRVVPIVIGGFMKASQLIGLDNAARKALYRQFIFDDNLSGQVSGLGGPMVSKTTNYTVKTSDNGTTFNTTGATGAVTFTLPAIASSQGTYLKFYNTVEQNMTITSAEGTNMVMPGFTAAAGGTNAAFSTPGQRSGGIIEVISDGTDWYVTTLSVNPLTTS